MNTYHRRKIPAAAALPFAILGVLLLSACNDTATTNSQTPGISGQGNSGRAGLIVRPPSATPAPAASTPTVIDTSAQLSWVPPTQNSDGSPLKDIAGYHIHMGASASTLTTVVDVPNATATTYTVNSLTAGTWYFGISAYTTTGVDGEISAVGQKTIS